MKTLKDIGHDDLIEKKELKEEVIKWVKKWEEEMKTDVVRIGYERLGRVWAMRDFFNLTEDDFK